MECASYMNELNVFKSSTYKMNSANHLFNFQKNQTKNFKCGFQLYFIYNTYSQSTLRVMEHIRKCDGYFVVVFFFEFMVFMFSWKCKLSFFGLANITRKPSTFLKFLHKLRRRHCNVTEDV